MIKLIIVSMLQQLRLVLVNFILEEKIQTFTMSNLLATMFLNINGWFLLEKLEINMFALPLAYSFLYKRHAQVLFLQLSTVLAFLFLGFFIILFSSFSEELIFNNIPYYYGCTMNTTELVCHGFWVVCRIRKVNPLVVFDIITSFLSNEQDLVSFLSKLKLIKQILDSTFLKKIQLNLDIMQAAMTVTRVTVSSKIQTRPARLTSVVVAGIREDATRIAQVAGVGFASAALALSANAAQIKMGSDDGSLVFSPNSVTVKAGEEITWVNNKGFPHNIVFDEDEVPEGVDADALSNEDYLNAPGETVVRKLTVPGTYGYYCEPHQGAGMKGSITVQ
eukprot:TRINITY_DN489_c0_g1_i4.p2 TRINITY_DN489_c0_g1~~TRINITY_DN489_c0_g1_i4.p2  ORF type:complete len:334 (-),score=36.67 TRINITY_DN489_c0_g1_i4:142-1143(-)